MLAGTVLHRPLVCTYDLIVLVTGETFVESLDYLRHYQLDLLSVRIDLLLPVIAVLTREAR